MTRRFSVAVFAAVLLITACSSGGSEEEGTTVPGSPETTGGVADTTEPDGDGPSVGIGDIPQECIDSFVEFLQAIEPIVENIDWENASLADLETVGADIEAATGDFEDMDECDDLNVDATDEESFQYMIDLARDEAPGTVGYFEMLRGFIGTGTDGDIGGPEVSNDCETDIAALQAIIDDGGTMQDLGFAEIAAVGNLSTSIGVNCPPDRSGEFFSQADVAAFFGG